MFFSVGVLSGGNPLWTRGEHANSTQKGLGDSPLEHCALWGGPAPQSQQRPMWESNPCPSCCEAAVQAVQATEPPCYILIHTHTHMHNSEWKQTITHTHSHIRSTELTHTHTHTAVTIIYHTHTAT